MDAESLREKLREIKVFPLLEMTHIDVKVEGLLPHRDEMLLVSCLKQIGSYRSSLVAKRLVSKNDPVFHGQEGIATRMTGQRELAVLAGVKGSRFFRMVRPTETVRIKLSVESLLDHRHFAASGIAHDRDGEKVLTCDLNVALVPIADVQAQ